MSNRGRGRGNGSDLEVEVCVVSIAMELYSMPVDDTTEGKHVMVKKDWTKNRALGDPTDNSVGAGLNVPQDHESYLLVRYD